MFGQPVIGPDARNCPNGRKMNELRNELEQNIEGLCDNGIRFPGTTGDANAASWLSRQMTECGLKTGIQQFQVMGWKINAPAQLIVKIPGEDPVKLECIALVYSASTPGGGAQGKLEYVGKRPLSNMKKFRVFERDNFMWNKYAIRVVGGDHSAHIISRDYPEKAPVLVWGSLELPYTIPTVLVSWESGRFLESIQNQDVQVSLTMETEFNPTAKSFNVIGDIPIDEISRPRDTILVTAHYDSQYNTVGAVDNASGISVLLALAKRWKSLFGRHRFRFIGFGAEEIGLLGAKNYLTYLKETGEIDRISAILNLDMLGCNQPNWVHLSDHQVVISAVQKALLELKIEEKYGASELVCPPWPTADQDPFFDENIPTICFTWKGSLYPYIHRPEDTIDKVDWMVTEDSFYLAKKILTYLSANL